VHRSNGAHRDCGDVDTVPISIERTLAAIDARVSAVIADRCHARVRRRRPLVTLGILRALARRHGRLGLVHFDAHPRYLDEYLARSTSTGHRFRRAVEEG